VEKGDTVRVGDCIFFYYWKRNKYHQLGTGFFVHNIIVSVVKSSWLVNLGHGV
jgi:hypothetical protein